jgi:mRNA-degrading endonuclease toxin of MazEF toxin-antitoxin module
MTDQVRAIYNNRLIRKVGIIPAALVKTIKENLKILFDPGGSLK